MKLLRMRTWPINARFTIVDGILGMGGPGPVAGMPKRFNIMLASTDVVAVDCVASKILRFQSSIHRSHKEIFSEKDW